MKVWELEEGKEYVAYDKNFEIGNYKIVDGEFLYYECDEMWSVSLRKFKELNELDFTECTPPTDWSKVPVDTKILVSGFGEEYRHRHFAKYKHGKVYAWCEGRTSFTSNGEGDISSWSYAKLYTEE